MVADGGGEAERDVRAPSAMSGPLTRYCTGRPTGGPSGSRLTWMSVPTKLVARDRLQPRLHAVAGLEVVGDDDDLAEVRARRLHVEGEHEAHRALADIGRPVRRCPRRPPAPPRSGPSAPGSRRSRRSAAASSRRSARAGRRTGRTAAGRSACRRATARRRRRSARSSPSASASRRAAAARSRAASRPGPSAVRLHRPRAAA